MSGLFARRPLACAGLLLLGVLGALTSSCSAPKPTQTQAPAPASIPSPLSAPLWGDLKPIVSVKELMKYMIDPVADNIFDAVKIRTNGKVSVETLPKTDEDWEKIQIGAVSIIEGVYLLKIKRPFAPPGDENNSTGPDAVELSPAQIMAKVEKDPVEWNARIEALRNVGLEVLDIVKRKDTKELWDAAENLDVACENCHVSYWYPGEDAHFWQTLNTRLQDHVAKQGGVTEAPTTTPKSPRK